MRPVRLSLSLSLSLPPLLYCAHHEEAPSGVLMTHTRKIKLMSLACHFTYQTFFLLLFSPTDLTCSGPARAFWRGNSCLCCEPVMVSHLPRESCLLHGKPPSFSRLFLHSHPSSLLLGVGDKGDIFSVKRSVTFPL